MKRIALLFFLVTVYILGQGFQSTDEGAMHSNEPETIVFTDRTTWRNEAKLTCVFGIILEDFDGLPAGETNCGTVIDSQGSDCFTPGEIVDDISVVASMEAGGDGTVVGVSTGTIGNAINLVGANSAQEFTVIEFSVAVIAAGLDIWNSTDTATDIRIYNFNDDLVDAFTLTHTVGMENFFGFIDDSGHKIKRIEIEEANGGRELFGILEFGECEVRVEESLLAQIVLYPNPVKDILVVRTPLSVEILSLEVYDLTGKVILNTISNGEINVSGLSKGVYILKMTTSAGTLTRKIVK